MKNFLLCNILSLIIIALSPIHARADLSNDAQEAKTLYEELKEFKDNPKFHQVGFARCCRFYKWMEKVQTLRSKKTGTAILMEVGFLPGDLLQLGMEYMKSRGIPTTSYSREMEATIAAGLAPEPQIEEGQGVVINLDRACVSLDSFKKFIIAINDKKFREAGTIIYGPDCSRVYEKTVVIGPLASEDLSFLGIVHQVKMPDGSRVWVWGNSIMFNPSPVRNSAERSKKNGS